MNDTGRDQDTGVEVQRTGAIAFGGNGETDADAMGNLAQLDSEWITARARALDVAIWRRNVRYRDAISQTVPAIKPANQGRPGTANGAEPID